MPIKMGHVTIDIKISDSEKKKSAIDAEYFALALKLNCPIWSEDKLLKTLQFSTITAPSLPASSC